MKEKRNRGEAVLRLENKGKELETGEGSYWQKKS